MVRCLARVRTALQSGHRSLQVDAGGFNPAIAKKPQAFTQGNRMRALAAGLVLAASAAIADDIGEAHRHAEAARDSYWNCLAEKHVSVNSRNMTAQEFALYVGGVCPSERQTFRVMLMHYLAMKFPSIDALATANNAIELAQKYIIERQAAPTQ